MSLSHWDEGSDSDQVTGLNRDSRLVGHRKILALQSAKLPRYGGEGRLRFDRSLPRRDHVSLSGKALR